LVDRQQQYLGFDRVPEVWLHRHDHRHREPVKRGRRRTLEAVRAMTLAPSPIDTTTDDLDRDEPLAPARFAWEDIDLEDEWRAVPSPE
jgi:hypothetical protein